MVIAAAAFNHPWLFIFPDLDLDNKNVFFDSVAFVNYHKYVGDEEWEAFETPSSRQQVTQSHISDAQKGPTNQDLVNNIGTKTEFIRMNSWALYIIQYNYK